MGIRTGDTPQRERARDARADPPDILITTPESLYLMLTSAARRDARRRRGGDRRRDPRRRGTPSAARIWRSRSSGWRRRRAGRRRAADRPLARPRTRSRRSGASWSARRASVPIVDAGVRKRSTCEIEVPVESMVEPDASSPPPSSCDPLEPAAPEATARARSGRRSTRSCWSWCATHRSTIMFVNNRRAAERLALLPERARASAEIARAHHGSLAREERTVGRGAAEGRRAAVPCRDLDRSSSGSTWAPSTS